MGDALQGGAHKQPLLDLPAALETGYAEVDAEHRLLMKAMSSLRLMCDDLYGRDHCDDCPEKHRKDCDNHLVGMLGDLLAFILEHFQNEEKMMRASLLMVVDREVCEAHIEDHANISESIQKIVAGLDPQRTVLQLRKLDMLLKRWLCNHIHMHDMLMARWMMREDNLLNTKLIHTPVW